MRLLLKFHNSKINKSNRKFYEFIYESGLGEKNSTGMGFINNVR